MRPGSVAIRDIKPRLLEGLLGVLTLALAIEAALATDPAIEFIERLGTNQVTIHFNMDANRTYIVQRSSGGSTGQWSDIYTNPASPFPNHYVLVATITNGLGFYRLVVTP